MKKRLMFFAVALIFLSSFAVAADDFTIGSLLIKVTVSQGDSVEKPLKIYSEDNRDFILSVEGIDGVNLEGEEFFINAGETKEIAINIDSSSLEPGIYVGKVKAVSKGRTVDLPIILEVESKNVLFDINLEIPPRYSEVAPGESLIAQIRAFDLTGLRTDEALGPVSVELEYQVISLGGDVLNFERENIVVDRQIQLSKTVSFPDSIDEGDYIFAVSAVHNSSVGTSTTIFSIKSPESEIIEQLDVSFVVVLIFVLLVFVGFVLFFVYLIHDRDKLFLELREYHTYELKKQREMLTEQARLLSRKSRPGRADDKSIKAEVAEKVVRLKKKQKQRTRQFRKLGRKGELELMKRKLAEWKKQGYGTLGLEYKLKGLSSSEMKALLSKWKKQGYKIKK